MAIRQVLQESEAGMIFAPIGDNGRCFPGRVTVDTSAQPSLLRMHVNPRGRAQWRCARLESIWIRPTWQPVAHHSKDPRSRIAPVAKVFDNDRNDDDRQPEHPEFHHLGECDINAQTTED